MVSASAVAAVGFVTADEDVDGEPNVVDVANLDDVSDADDAATVSPELVVLRETVSGDVVEPCVGGAVDEPVVTVVGSSVVTVAACVVF